MSPRTPSIRLVLLALSAHLVLAVSVALAQQPAGTLSAEQLQILFRGKTWAMEYGGVPDLLAIWDFNTDGSLCGRLSGAKAGTKCADIGKWKLQGDMICWDFNWLGEGYSYKSVCAHVRKADDRTYLLTDQSGKLPPLPFHPVTQSTKNRK
jgi:hypothetical protein